MQIKVILAVGLDSSLYHIKSSAWESAGYLVRSASSLNEAIEHVRNGDFDLVLLGQFIPPESRERLSLLIRASGLHIPIAYVASSSTDSHDFVDANLTNHPGELLKDIEELLANHARMRVAGVIRQETRKAGNQERPADVEPTDAVTSITKQTGTYSCGSPRQGENILVAKGYSSEEDLKERNRDALSDHVLDAPSQHAVQILLQHASEHLFELSPESIIITDAEGVIRSTNPAATGLFGYTSAEFYGRSIEDLIPQPFRTAHLIHRENYAAHPRTRSMDSGSNLFGLRKDGTEFPVDVMLKPIGAADGQGVICIVRDMTEQRAALEFAQRNERQMHSVVEAIRDYAIYFLDPEGNVKTWNPGGEHIKGYSAEEALGRHFSQFFTQEDVDIGKPAQLLRDAAFNGGVESEGWRVRKDGSRFWADVTLTPIRGLKGEITGYATVTRDTTERRQAKELATRQTSDEFRSASAALHASEARYHTVYQTSPEAVTISRISDGVIVDVNAAFVEVSGYERKEAIGQTMSSLRLWAHASDRFRCIKILLEKTFCRDVEFQFRRKDGDVFWARLSVSLIEVDGNVCVLSFARDISEDRAAQEKIRALAFYDPLTGLANRRLLMDRLAHSIAATSRNRSKRALMFIDLDDFKALNDTSGHQIGDLLLQEVARRLTSSIRETDTVGRLGGDEFVVMLEDLSDNLENAISYARVVAEKILSAVALPYVLGDRDCSIASSIGITMISDNKISTNEVLQQADIAMYQAKARGRNMISFFTADLDSAIKCPQTGP